MVHKWRVVQIYLTKPDLKWKKWRSTDDKKHVTYNEILINRIGHQEVYFPVPKLIYTEDMCSGVTGSGSRGPSHASEERTLTF